jgi:hypothetical protein
MYDAVAHFGRFSTPQGQRVGGRLGGLRVPGHSSHDHMGKHGGLMEKLVGNVMEPQ